MVGLVLLVLVCVLVSAAIHVAIRTRWLATVLATVLGTVAYVLSVIWIDGALGAFGALVVLVSMGVAALVAVVVGGAMRAARN